MANGCLEIRVWIGGKYFRVQHRIIEGLIDWSVVDGRTVSEEDRSRDSSKREEARRLLRSKSVRRKLNVRYARKDGVEGGVDGEGSMLSEEASDAQVRRASVSGSREGQEQQADEGFGEQTDEE